jgi:BolA family transcriptional regulator, general stress-responsive regulator
MTERIEQIATCLQILQPVELQIVDESHQHAGHAGAQSGGGHYRLTLVSAAFIGKNKMTRHRMIYSALAAMMEQHIHALTIQALAPNETI